MNDKRLRAGAPPHTLSLAHHPLHTHHSPTSPVRKNHQRHPARPHLPAPPPPLAIPLLVGPFILGQRGAARAAVFPFLVLLAFARKTQATPPCRQPPQGAAQRVQAGCCRNLGALLLGRRAAALGCCNYAARRWRSSQTMRGTASQADTETAKKMRTGRRSACSGGAKAFHSALQ